MNQFRSITAALDMLGFPGASLDAWKSRSDREGEEDIQMRACVPCEDGYHDRCWAPPDKPWWYVCLCRKRGHND